VTGSPSPTGSTAGFEPGRELWLARLGNLRNVVRQHLVATQLDAARRDLLGDRADRPLTVLDVGAGQGTQALRLARGGHRVTAVDIAEDMLAPFRAALESEPPAVRRQVTLQVGDVRDLPGEATATGLTTYDLVLCHGVLMYLDDPGPALAGLAAATAPGGVLSLVARNREAMALRHAMRRQWAKALDAFDATGYVNELGVAARADTVDDLTRRLAGHGLVVERWHGVRVLSDGVPLDEPVPPPDGLATLLAAEERAGSTDPYRGVGPLVHLLARRPAGPPVPRRS
jgi:S-adenosylmethionine-dependent methyltransferase